MKVNVFFLAVFLAIGISHGQNDASSATTTSTEPDTTTATTTTEPSTTTTSPAPSHDEFYRITDKNNVTCIMFSADFTVEVTFNDTNKKEETTKIELPRPSDKKDVIVKGECVYDANTTEYITLEWGPTNGRSQFHLLFNSTGDKWMMTEVSMSIYIDSDDFKNASDASKFLDVSGTLPDLSFVSIDTNSSLICRSNVEADNFTASVENSTETYSVVVNALGFQVQAFNAVPNTKTLQQGRRCEADMTSDLVPIAVGCALAGLVLLVLITYLVGRRRRSAAYESV